MAAMSPKQEPWFKPRPDEDADDKLLDWLGGGGKGTPPADKSNGWGCPMVAAPVVAVVVLVATLLFG
jgi:hypothetical protein